MTNTYRIRPAVLDDRPAIYGLIGSAATWLREEKDTDQWTRPWPNRDDRDARITQGIMDGLTWMVEDSEGAVIGTVTCREHGNDILWTPTELAERAAYVSRLIVSRDHAGQGIGAALIHWCPFTGAAAPEPGRSRARRRGHLASCGLPAGLRSPSLQASTLLALRLMNRTGHSNDINMLRAILVQHARQLAGHYAK